MLLLGSSLYRVSDFLYLYSIIFYKVLVLSYFFFLISILIFSIIYWGNKDE